MQDIGLLKSLPRFRDTLRDFDRLWRLAGSRALEQITASSTPDGMHVENSPGYHLHFLGLVTDAVEAYRGQGEPAPAAMVAARDALIESIVFMLQPDNTLPQFGDTQDDTARRQLARIGDLVRGQSGDPDVLDHLDWATSGGTRGAPPRELDRVFPNIRNSAGSSRRARRA